jgi:hypothetical protein
MIDLHPAPVPELSEEWLASHRAALLEALPSRRRHPMRWAAVAAVGSAAASVSTVVLVGGSAQSAFAGWSASPTPPASGQISDAVATCEGYLAKAAQSQPSDKGPAPDVASFVPELSDVRGPYTVTVLGDGGQNAALCIADPQGSISLRWLSSSGMPVTAGTVAVDQVSILARDGQPYTLVVGRTGAGVTGVSLTLGNGTDVTATSGDGIFVAWWPGSQSITSATVSTASGSTAQQLDLPGPVLPPAGDKSPPPSGGAQSSSTDSQGNSTVCLLHACGQARSS